jgi:MOSC domain-containing protein YiiM
VGIESLRVCRLDRCRCGGVGVVVTNLHYPCSHFMPRDGLNIFLRRLGKREHYLRVSNASFKSSIN